MTEHITPLYAKSGRLHAVMLSPEFWAKAEGDIRKLHDRLFAPAPEERPEPMADFESLKQFWDFPYPLDMAVNCEHCGNATQDWSADEPRKFRLAAANIGGMVSFICTQCRSRITKRHFKNKVDCECRPHVDSKDPHMEARY